MRRDELIPSYHYVLSFSTLPPHAMPTVPKPAVVWMKRRSPHDDQANPANQETRGPWEIQTLPRWGCWKWVTVPSGISGVRGRKGKTARSLGGWQALSRSSGRRKTQSINLPHAVQAVRYRNPSHQRGPTNLQPPSPNSHHNYSPPPRALGPPVLPTDCSSV